MRKIIALLLAVVMCLSLCACGSNKELAKYEKYETLINYLEANDYASAIAEITQMQISGGGNDSTDGNDNNNQKVIEITLDNWQEYFEIRLIAAEQINAFGECSGISTDIRLCLKEEHKNTVVDMDVAVEYTCTDGYSCWFTYNKQTSEIVEGEKITYSVSDAIPLVMDVSNTFTMKQANIEQGISLLYWGGAVANAEWEGNIATFKGSMYSNIEIVRIQGTITISA